eukprot:m.223159 g.223159  ORF g.223159 m.223159 type:complete len:115 (+) comp16190_c0_seq1:51-395(+)
MYRASHLLVKHEESRRCSSWKDVDGHQIRARTKQQAVEILNGHRQRIVNKEVSFADLARTESDCGSAAQGGDLGEFGPGMMQAPFEQAVKNLKVGELSGIVHTESGAHIILRTK